MCLCHNIFPKHKFNITKNKFFNLTKHDMSLFTQQCMLTLRYWTSMSNILHGNAKVQILVQILMQTSMQTITKHTQCIWCAHILSEWKLSKPNPLLIRSGELLLYNLFSFAYTTHTENRRKYIRLQFSGCWFHEKKFSGWM